MKTQLRNRSFFVALATTIALTGGITLGGVSANAEEFWSSGDEVTTEAVQFNGYYIKNNTKRMLYFVKKYQDQGIFERRNGSTSGWGTEPASYIAPGEEVYFEVALPGLEWGLYEQGDGSSVVYKTLAGHEITFKANVVFRRGRDEGGHLNFTDRVYIQGDLSGCLVNGKENKNFCSFVPRSDIKKPREKVQTRFTVNALP